MVGEWEDVPSRHAVEDDERVFLDGVVEVGFAGNWEMMLAHAFA